LHLPFGNQKRVTIGFFLIRQSSASPIVCVHRSNQISAIHSIGVPRRFVVVPWTTSGGLGAPAALPSGNIRLAFRKRNPMGRNHCHPALKNDSGLAHWCPRGSKSGSLLLQKPLGKRERTHAHSPVLGVQANLIAFRDACTFCHRPSACEGSPIAKFRDSLNCSNGQRGDILRANKSNDAKTSGFRMSSSRQRSTASA